MCEVARAYGKKIVDIDLTETEHTIWKRNWKCDSNLYETQEQ
jgi:hypothetical protein